MRSELRTIANVAAAVLSSVVVGQAAAGVPLAARLTAVLVFCGLALAVVVRPALAVHVALAVLVLELLIPTWLLRVAATLLLLGGVFAAWRAAKRVQRIAATLLLALTGWVSLFGVILAPPALQQQGIAIAFLFAGALAACAVVSAPSAGHIVLNLGCWGLVTAAWVLSHPGELAARSGDIFAGENADGLGMLIAIGAVALVGYALERRRSLLPLAALGAVISFQALVVTASRGALLAFAVGLIMAAFASSWVHSPPKVIAIGVFALPALWLGAEWAAFGFLEASGRDIVVQHGFDLRSRLARFAWEQALDHPLTGIGVGRLEELGTSTGGVGVAASAHNTFLGLLAAAGFPALFLLVAVMLIAARRAMQATPRLGLALLVAVTGAGLSIEWWASSRLAPLFMLCVALCIFEEQPAREYSVGAEDPQYPAPSTRTGDSMSER